MAVKGLATYRLLLEILTEPAGHDIDFGVMDVRVDVAIERTITGAEVLGTV